MSVCISDALPQTQVNRHSLQSIISDALPQTQSTVTRYSQSSVTLCLRLSQLSLVTVNHQWRSASDSVNRQSLQSIISDGPDGLPQTQSTVTCYSQSSVTSFSVSPVLCITVTGIFCNSQVFSLSLHLIIIFFEITIIMFLHLSFAVAYFHFLYSFH